MIRVRVLCVVAVVVLAVVLFFSMRQSAVRGPGKLTVDRTTESSGRPLALVTGSDADLWECHDQFMIALWPRYRAESFILHLRDKFRRYGVGSNYATQIVQNRRYAKSSIEEMHSLYFLDYGAGRVGLDKAIAVLRGAGWEVTILERVGDESIE